MKRLHVRGIKEGTPAGKRYRFLELEALYMDFGQYPEGCEPQPVDVGADDEPAEGMSKMQMRRAGAKRLRAESNIVEVEVRGLEEEVEYHERMAEKKRAEIAAILETLEKKGKF